MRELGLVEVNRGLVGSSPPCGRALCWGLHSSGLKMESDLQPYYIPDFIFCSSFPGLVCLVLFPFRLQISDFRSHVSDSRFRISYCGFQISEFRFQTSYFRFRIYEFRFQFSVQRTQTRLTWRCEPTNCSIRVYIVSSGLQLVAWN